MHRPRTQLLRCDRRLLVRSFALASVVLLCASAAPRARAQADTAPADDEDVLDDEALEEATRATVAPPSDVEVIRIKGRAVTAIQTDIPESATQFDAATIEAMGAQNISDLAKVTPNVEIVTSGSTSPTFFIRGVGLSDFNANAGGSVAIYQDDVSINAPAIQLGQLFDVENVEVLLGPQGGGSGRNASAGAIKVYSRKPTGDTTAEFQASYGRFNAQDYQGALEVPILDEILSSRFAFRWVKRDGYVENGCAPSFDSPVPVDSRLLGIVSVGDDRLPPVYEGVGTKKQNGPIVCGERLQQTRNPRRFNNPEDFEFEQPSQVFVSYLLPNLEDRLNDSNNWSVRGQFRLQPPDTDMDWLLNAHGGRRDELSVVGQAMGTQGGNLGQRAKFNYWEPDNRQMQIDLIPKFGGETDELKEALAVELANNLDIDRFRGDFSRTGQTTLDSWGTFLRGEGAIDSARWTTVNWTTISAYDGYRRSREEDQDFTPNVLFESITEDEAWQFSQEIKFDGELEEIPLRWEAGGYYLMEKLHFDGQNLLFRKNLNSRRVYDQDLYSFAFFVGFSWDFLDDFTLEGGARYNWEQKDFDYSFGRAGTLFPDFQSRVWQAPTGTISLSYRPAEDISVYWKYSRGWKGGQFNASSTVLLGNEPAEPESIDAFEIGMRGRWLDGRLGIGGSLFYYKYSNYQVFVVIDAADAPPNIEIVNANDAEVYGAELNVRAEPLDGLVLTGRLGWLETQFLDFSNTIFRQFQFDDGSVRTVPLVADYSGNQLINSPRLKASLAVEWTIELGRFGSLIPRYDFSWSDDIAFDQNEGRGAINDSGEFSLPENTTGQRAYWLHNARLAYRTPEGNIEVAGWVRNFTNQPYKTFAFDASSFTDLVVNYVGEPRMFGGSISVSW